MCDFVCAKLIGFYKDPVTREETRVLLLSMLNREQNYAIWNSTSIGNLSAILYHIGSDDDELGAMAQRIWDGYVNYRQTK